MIEIPKNVNIIAIGVGFLSKLTTEKEGKKIIIIRKTYPSHSIPCCEHGEINFSLHMLVRGGVLLSERNRKLRYARVERAVTEFGTPIDILHGYLVFERLNEKEWTVTDKAPEAFAYFIHYVTDTPTDCYADYEVVRTKNVFAVEKSKEVKHGYSGAGLAFLASAKEPAVIEYKRSYDYDGCRELYERVRVAWNNGNVTVEPIEEVKRVI